MIPFVKSNPIKLMPLRLHDMHLTSGRILNSIVLWMNYAINLKPCNRQFGFYMKHKTAMKNNLIASLTKPILVLYLL